EVQQRVRATVAIVFVVRRRAIAAEVYQGGGRGVGAGRRARYGVAREPVLHVGRAEHEDARRAAVDDVALDAVVADLVLRAARRDDHAGTREVGDLQAADRDAVRANDQAVAELPAAINGHGGLTVVARAAADRYVRRGDRRQRRLQLDGFIAQARGERDGSRAAVAVGHLDGLAERRAAVSADGGAGRGVGLGGDRSLDGRHLVAHDVADGFGEVVRLPAGVLVAGARAFE